MKKNRAQRFRNGNKKGRREDVADLAAQLAPLEEIHETASQRASQNNHGVIRLDTSALNLPKSLRPNDEDKPTIFRAEPVVFSIIIASLIFIAFIAWKVSQMPLPKE